MSVPSPAAPPARLPIRLSIGLAIGLVLGAGTSGAVSPGRAAQQEPDPSKTPDVPLAAAVRRIFDEALSSRSSYSLLEALCRDHPHRLAGSPDAANAVAWAKAEMERAGLENVRLEACTVPHWVRGQTATLRVTSPESAAETFLPILALGGSVGTPREGVEGELVRVESLDELDRVDGGTRGKVVLFDRPMDPRVLDPFDAYGGAIDQRVRGAIEAGRRGAVGAIVRSLTLRTDDRPHTGAMRYDPDVERIPAAAVSTAGAERLAALLRSGARVRVALRLDCADRAEEPSANVVGEIRGASRPDEIVLIGAHLDAWDVGQGAHDDGSGCVHVIEAMRILRSLDLRPQRTIRAVLFMNEENGLRGGLAYRDAHADELDRHALAIESDRGGFVPRGFATDAEGDALEALREVSALLEPAGASMLRPGEGGADISTLRRRGVRVAELVTDPSRYFDLHHSTRDTLDTVNPRELALGAAALASMAYGAAQADERLSPGGR